MHLITAARWCGGASPQGVAAERRPGASQPAAARAAARNALPARRPLPLRRRWAWRREAERKREIERSPADGAGAGAAIQHYGGHAQLLPSPPRRHPGGPGLRRAGTPPRAARAFERGGVPHRLCGAPRAGRPLAAAHLRPGAGADSRPPPLRALSAMPRADMACLLRSRPDPRPGRAAYAAPLRLAHRAWYDALHYALCKSSPRFNSPEERARLWTPRTAPCSQIDWKGQRHHGRCPSASASDKEFKH